MTWWSKRKMKKLLENLRVAIQNLFGYPTLKDRLLRFGINDDKLNLWLSKTDNAESLLIGRRTKFGLQLRATKKLLDMIDEAFNYYWDFASLVKVQLRKDLQTLEILGLRGKRKKNLMGFIMQAKQFFQGLIDNPDILTIVSDMGINQQVIDDGLSKLVAIEAENVVQEALKGESQNLTQLRNAAFDEIYDIWLFLKSAIDREFGKSNQIKEIFKVLEYSPNYKKKKATEEPEEEPGTEEPQDEPSEQPVNYTEDINKA